MSNKSRSTREKSGKEDRWKQNIWLNAQETLYRNKQQKQAGIDEVSGIKVRIKDRCYNFKKLSTF